MAIVALAVLATLGSKFRTTIFEYVARSPLQPRTIHSRARARVCTWSLPALVRIQRVDVRPTRAVVAGQEVLSADGVAVKGSVVATYQVVEPQKGGPRQRRLQGRGVFGAAARAASGDSGDAHRRPPAAAGRDPRAPESDCRREGPPPRRRAAGRVHARPDVSGRAQEIFTQVVKARQEGLAALEKARGETAALRNLANAAQMVERNPALIQLRLLQVLAQQPGNTVVLGMPPGGTPIPVRGASPAPDLSPPDEPSGGG